MDNLSKPVAFIADCGTIVSLLAHSIGDKLLAQKIWNACRAAMLDVPGSI